MTNNEIQRLDWDILWINFAKLVSKRSPHPTFKVGSVIVSADNTRVLSIGYNGDYAGGPNTIESEVPGMSGFIHAEVNSLIKMDYHANCDKKMFVTLSPCLSCAKLIINSGIKQVFYSDAYRDDSGISLLIKNNIKVSRIFCENSNILSAEDICYEKLRDSKL